jgi:hypothetical protein
MDHFSLRDPRRHDARIHVDTLCSELSEGRERHGFVVDLSATGLRVQRPYTGGGTPRQVQLELELPGLDEIIWARGAVCYDWLTRPRGTPPGEMLRTSGIRFVAAAARDLRLLRDYVFETRRAREAREIADSLCFSSAFALG